MRADHMFHVLDSHSGGAPSRLVLSGVPQLAGTTVMEKMHDFAAHHDWIRRALVLEPRGRGLTSAVVLLPPTRPDADVGAFFMEAHGYLPMCGSDTISTVTVLLETGQLPIEGPQTLVRLDTPAGLIEATARVEDGHVRSVSFVGAPAFCLLPDQKLEVPGWGLVQLDVSYGGNFYAIVDAAQFDLDLAPDTVDRAVAVAAAVHRAASEELDVQHPALPSVRGVTHVQLFNEPSDGAGPTKVMVILPRGLVDRSPCGTGTTAKVATLYSKGLLELGRPFVHRSVTGASFTGRPVEPCEVGPVPACRVEITGSAYLTADSTIYLDKDDELADGFQLG
jgi:proline racemase